MEVLKDVRTDPLSFVKCAFPWRQHFKPLQSKKIESWQAEVMETLRKAIEDKEKIDKDEYTIRVAVKSGQGVGKTALLSWIILWFMSTRVDPKIVVTANTESQLKNIDWRELAKWHKLSFNKELFEWTATAFYLKQSPETWRASAIPYNENNTEAFQGMHENDMLIIFDEASGVPESIWEVIEGTIKTGKCIFLAFSNPTQNRGHFRQCFGLLKHRWHNITVDSRRVSFTNKKEIAEDIETYGEDSDYVRVRIKGEFPKEASNQYISGDLIEKSIKWECKDFKNFIPIISVDVARRGDDESVITIRQGRKVHGQFGFRGLDGKALALKIVNYANKMDTTIILLDGIGVGASPLDFLRHFGYEPIDVQSGESADNKARYVKRRDEMYGRLYTAMKEGLDLPDTEDIRKSLKPQLECLTYNYTDNLQLKLDKKKDLIKKGFSSPDRADSLALSYAFNVNDIKGLNNNINVVNSINNPVNTFTSNNNKVNKYKVIGV